MDSTIASSTVTESCISSEASPPPPSNIAQLLEISLISAQDLAPISKPMQTYAVAWINPNRKRTTQTDQHGHKNPEWNDKFIFRLDNHDLIKDAVLTVEIYTVSWFRNVLVGSVRVSISDLITPLYQTAQDRTKQTHFVKLQIRRPSGGPQGTLNMGVALMDSTMRSMPLHNYVSQQQKSQHYHDNNSNKLNTKIHLWRSMSTGSSDLHNDDDFTSKPGSVYNGSELCSDIGPSPSVVAEERARKLLPPSPGKAADDTASSILEVMTIEEAKARGYRVVSKERRRKKAAASEYCGDESELSISNRHSRRRSDGGLFSCIAYGIEFTIACGASKNLSNNGRRSGDGGGGGGGRRRKASELNSA